MLTIDGVEYDVKVGIRRTSEMRISDISGMLLDKSIFTDMFGQYLVYEIDLLYPLYNQTKYAALYEALTEPVDAHQFVLPYNNGTVTLTASVDTVEDEVLEFDNGRTFWRSARFMLNPAAPTKTMSLSQVITRGRAPLPDVATPSEGDTYVWINGEWLMTSYADADNISY